MANNETFSCYILVFVIWLAINVADAWWIYFCLSLSFLRFFTYLSAYFYADVTSTVNPVPHNAIDRSSSARDGFTAMMFIFGFFLSCVNSVACYAYVSWSREYSSYRMSKFQKTMRWLGIMFIAFPFWCFMIIMPFFGGWIVTPIVQKHIWNHGCDSYPMFVILDGKSYNDPSYTVNRAYFSVNTPSTSNPTQLFTYEITNPGDGDEWLFSLRSFDVPQSSILLDFYPTLQQVYYDFNRLTVAGNCTLPNSTAQNTSVSIHPCMTGTFDPGSHLFFNISSSIPLNSTLSSVYPSGVDNATTALSIPDNGWSYSHYAPALKLQQLDNADRLGHLVLKTTVTKPHDATELKVCVDGVEGRDAGTVMPEALTPLGIVLMRQADFALYATQPNAGE